MNKIKEIMRNDGFDYDNLSDLKGTDFYHALIQYKNNYDEFDELESEDQKAEGIVSIEMQEQNLIQIFRETVITEDDPEIENLRLRKQESDNRAFKAEEDRERIKAKAEEDRLKYEEERAEQKRVSALKAEERAEERAEEKRISDIREEKLLAIEDKANLANEEKLYLLNNKRKLTYPELEKVGIKVETAPRKFEWNGYVFEKQWMFKCYVILSRPK